MDLRDEERLSQLRFFPIFSQTDDNVLLDIKLFHLGGWGSKTTGIFVTANDEVFSIGSNVCGCLGIGQDETTLESTETPVRIKNLCGKYIREISSGFGFFLARSENGKLFSWGRNLSLGSKSSVTTPTEMKSLAGQRVTQIACGRFHSLALTFSGEVYAWGVNDFGVLGRQTQGENVCQSEPIKLENCDFDNKKVNFINCGMDASVAVTTDGEVFVWGDNRRGQLGLNMKSNYILEPTKLQFPSPQEIVKVICGKDFMLALSKYGDLFTWGSTGSPIQILFEISPIVELVGVWTAELNICCAQGKVYFWDRTNLRKFESPYETEYRNIQEALAENQVHGLSLVFPKPLRFRAIREHLQMLFDDDDDGRDVPDVHFKFGDKVIRAHKYILQKTSFYFRNIFDWDKVEVEEREGPVVIEAKDSSSCSEGVRFEIFRAFLQYIYTNLIELTEPNDVADLYLMAYFMFESKLQRNCVTMMLKALNVENAIEMYKKAVIIGDKETVDSVVRFMVDNLEFMETDQMDEELMARVSKCLEA